MVLATAVLTVFLACLAQASPVTRAQSEVGGVSDDQFNVADRFLTVKPLTYNTPGP